MVTAQANHCCTLPFPFYQLINCLVDTLVLSLQQFQEATYITAQGKQYSSQHTIRDAQSDILKMAKHLMDSHITEEQDRTGPNRQWVAKDE